MEPFKIFWSGEKRIVFDKMSKRFQGARDNWQNQ
jgi:hypothetical protein